MPMIQTRDGVNLFYKEWGRGRPVVLIHGWPLTSDTWDDTAIAIADSGFRAIAYDRRGFGRSDQPYDGYDYNQLTDDMADLIQHLALSDMTLVGFSMGGGEVARYMSRYKAKSVRQAVLISSIVPYMLKTADNPHGVGEEVFKQMASGMRQDRAAFFESFFKDFFGVGLLSAPVSVAVLRWCERQAMMAGLKATLDCANSFATTDFRGDLPAFNLPTLIIHGTGDQNVPIETSGRAAARGIPLSKLIEYEGAPHGLFASHKDRLSRDLITFLKAA